MSQQLVFPLLLLRYKFKLIEIVQQLDMVMLLDYRSIFGSWYMRTAVLLIPVSQ